MGFLWTNKEKPITGMEVAVKPGAQSIAGTAMSQKSGASIPVATLVSDSGDDIQTAYQSLPQYDAKVTTSDLPPPSSFSPSDPTLARVPMLMNKCPNCHQESRTRITTYPTWQTWTASGVMLIVFWPICWVPLILDNCKQTDHYCVLCQAKVGKVDAFQDCCVTERS